MPLKGHTIAAKSSEPAEKVTGLLNYLVRDGVLNINEAQNAITMAQQQNISLTQFLVRSLNIASDVLLQSCAKHSGIPIFDLNHFQERWLTESIIKFELINRHRVLPLNRDHEYLYLGITDPTDHVPIATIGFDTGLRIRPMLVDEEKLNQLIVNHSKENTQAELESSLSKMTVEEPPLKAQEIDDTDEPVIEFVDRLIKDAILKQASDIHIEQLTDICRIRFRCDGFLYETATLPKNLALRIITRLKIMANMNISERRLPQDGRIHFQRNHKIDIRINTCPTLYGEKIVLRLLDPLNMNLDIHSLGFRIAQNNLFLKYIQEPQGLILVTGPTGSGKTTTLYSALHYVNTIEKNIVTIEDPVEIELNGINQININVRIGFDFASVLRAILRQDPDIVMIGEIRDHTTAEIAMQASQTGHLVFSTLHTNSAIETIIRLQSMGIPNYHITSSISLIIAQRLARKRCLYCREKSNDRCTHCHQGYKGRVGIFEFLPMTREIAEIILSGASANTILERAKVTGYQQLWDHAREIVSMGITNDTEIKRILGAPNI